MSQPSPPPSGHDAGLSTRLLDAMRELVFEVDSAGRVSAANASARRYLGLDGDLDPLTTLFDWLHPDDRQRMPKLLTPEDKGDPGVIRLRLMATSGGYRGVGFTRSASDRSGHWILVGRVSDPLEPAPSGSSTRERMRMLELNAHLDSIINSSSRTGILLVDQAARVIIANDYIARLIYLATGATITPGSTIYNFAPPDMVDLLKQNVTRALAGEELSNRTDQLMDGETRSFVITYNPVFGPERTPTAVTIFVEEVTEERRLERELRENLERYQLLLNGVQDGIGITATDESFIFVNPAGARVFGYSQDELIGKTLYELLPEDEHARLEKETALRKKNESSAYEIDFLRKDGERRTMQVTASPQRLDDGELRIFAVFRDVTEQRRLERKLRDSLESLELLLNGVGEGIGIGGEHEDFIYINEAGANIFGLSSEEILGRDLLEFLPDDQKAKLQQQTARRRKGETSSYELDFLTATGERRTMAATAAPQFTAEGFRTFFVFRDITESLRAEREVRAAGQRLRAVFDQANDAICTIDLESNRFKDANDLWLQWSGYSMDELRQLSPEDLHDPDRIDEIDQERKELIEQGRIVFELPLLAKDDKVHPLEASASLVTVNDRATVLVVARDISERLQAQQALRESEQRFRSVIQNSPAGICVLDDHGFYEYVNEAYEGIVGYSSSELLGEHFAMVIPPERIEETTTGLGVILEAGGNYRQTFPVLTKSGEIRTVLTDVAPMTGRDGHTKALAFLVDVTERERAVEALRASEAYNAALVRALPDPVFRVDRDGVIIDYHAPDTVRLGIAREELAGSRLSDLPMPESVHRDILSRVRRALDDGEPGLMEYQIEVDGQLLIHETRIIPEDQSIALCLVRDITERKKAEESLRTSERRLQALFNLSPDAIFIVDILSGAMVSANPAAADLTGYAVDELVGRHWQDLHADETYVEMFQAVVDGKIPESSPIDAEVLHRDGSVIPVEIRARTLEIDGRAHLLGTFRNISTRVRDEERNRFQSQLLAAVQQAAIATDLRGRITYWNRHAELMYGWTAGEVIGELIANVQPDRPLPGRTFAISRHLRPGQSWTGEVILQRKDGSELPVLTSTSPILDGQGKLQGTLGITTDISSRKEYEAALKKARKDAEAASEAKSSFLTNMSHEIRTPMNSILGFSELLTESIEDPKLKEYLNAVKVSAGSLMQLINDILDLSRIEAGRLELQPRVLRTRDLLRDIRHLFEQTALRKNLDFQVNAGPSLPDQVMLDDIRVRQILTNLVGNALKFTEQGFVHLTLDSRPQEGRDGHVTLLIDVQDSGPGIPKEQRQRIFDDFFQIENQDHRRYAGTGLGLAITRRLVSMMQGGIELESEPGNGARFLISLPDIAVVDSSAQPPVLDTESPRPRFSPATIVLAEDEHFNRRLVEEFLSDQPFTLIHAEDGEQAIVEIRRHRPDLVLLDLRMPGADGYSVLEAMREDELINEIPVLVLSASLVENEERRVNQAGARGFLRKPLTRPQLLDGLAPYLRRDSVLLTSSEDDRTTRPAVSTPHSAAGGEALQLMDILNDQILPLWTDLSQVFSRKAAHDLVMRMRELENDYPCPRLRSYLDTAANQLEHYQLNEFLEHVHQLPRLLEAIRRDPHYSA